MTSGEPPSAGGSDTLNLVSVYLPRGLRQVPLAHSLSCASRGGSVALPSRADGGWWQHRPSHSWGTRPQRFLPASLLFLLQVQRDPGAGPGWGELGAPPVSHGPGACRLAEDGVGQHQRSDAAKREHGDGPRPWVCFSVHGNSHDSLLLKINPETVGQNVKQKHVLLKEAFIWRIIALRYCGGFCHSSTWISHRHPCVSSLLSFPPRSHPTPPPGLSQSTVHSG